jgi:hypothetical protein
MPDIKPEIAAGENQPFNEKKIFSQEASEERIGRGVEMEKIREIDQARKNVMAEVAQMENQAPVSIGPIGAASAPQAKMQKQVENVLAQGLADVYLNLTPQKRQEFKKAGEQTAQKINQLLSKTKINIGEIIELIKKWLSLIPGMNKYFLEQEAKIKADELIKLRNK